MEMLLAVDGSFLPLFYDALMATEQRDVVLLMSFKGPSFMQSTYGTFVYLLMIYQYCQLCWKVIILHLSVKPLVGLYFLSLSSVSIDHRWCLWCVQYRSMNILQLDVKIQEESLKYKLKWSSKTHGSLFQSCQSCDKNEEWFM